MPITLYSFPQIPINLSSFNLYELYFKLYRVRIEQIFHMRTKITLVTLKFKLNLIQTCVYISTMYYYFILFAHNSIAF